MFQNTDYWSNYAQTYQKLTQLNNQIAFQKTNENLQDSVTEATNSVQSAMVMMNAQFNQIFNYVNYIDHIVLGPLESISVIVAFLPELKDRERDNFDFIEVNGSLFFICFILPSGSTELPSLDGLVNPDYQATTKFRSRVCKSVLSTDISLTGISFGDCIVGETYTKELTVGNKSEIDLFWSLTQDISNPKTWIRFLNIDDDNFECNPLSAYSTKRVRVEFTPLEVGQFNYDFQLENLNDSQNIVQVHIHALVRSIYSDEKLLISSGYNLDFGDCCAGNVQRKHIVVKNVGKKPLEITFGSDIDGEIVFELLSDEIERSNDLLGGPKNQSFAKSPWNYVRSVTDSIEPTNFTPSERKISSVFESDPRLLERFSMSERADQSIHQSFSELSLSKTKSSASSVTSNSLFPELEYYHNLNFEGSVEGRDSHAVGQPARIEELTIRPGMERTIVVCYSPFKEVVTPDYRTSQLSTRKFRILLTYSTSGDIKGEEKTSIQCVSRVCTSAIEVSPKVIQFGDTDVCTLKSSSFEIKNHSELPTIVELRYTSKVLSSVKGELVIPAKQKIEVKLDIFPRKVNPDYRKEITVANLLNPENNQLVEVFSTNVDKQMVTLHSSFYRIWNPQNTNFVDFGNTVLNSISLRSLKIENITNKVLKLQITSAIPKDLTIYKTEKKSPKFVYTGKKDLLLQKIEEGRTTKRTVDISKSVNMLSLIDYDRLSSTTYQSENLAYLDLAINPTEKGSERPSVNDRHSRSTRSSVAKRDKSSRNVVRPFNINSFNSKLQAISDSLNNQSPENSSKLNWDRLSVKQILKLAENETGKPIPLFSNSAADEAFVKLHQNIRRILEEYVSSGKMIPLSEIELQPHSQQTIYFVLKMSGANRPDIQSKPKKVDSTIFIKMIDFDKTLIPSNSGLDAIELPIREMMIHTLVSRSVMDLGQKNINFGNVDKTESRTKRIVIRNKSEVPLLYSIRKSGSVASGDLIFSEYRAGVIRGYGAREVEFVFDPSLPGIFQEKITIENVLNPENDQALIVKSNIKQHATFYIESPLVSFGVCKVDHTPVMQSITISNTSKKQVRIFEVRVDPAELKFHNCLGEIWFSVDGDEDESTRRMIISKEAEEKIEQLEQKLKIATRKGQEDKILKISDQLQKLRSGKTSMPLGGLEIEDMPEGSNNSQKGAKDNFMHKVKATDNSIIFSINPRCIKQVRVFFRPFLKPQNGIEQPNFAFSNNSLSEYNVPDNNCEFCSVRIYIHEKKNMDVVKRVVMNATVCFDEETYQRMKEVQKLTSQNDQETHLDLNNVAEQNQLEETRISSASQTKEISNLMVERTLIDLGKVELNEIKDCYFNLSNTTDEKIDYIISCRPEYRRSVKKIRNRGYLAPRELRQINIAIQPQNLGMESIQLVVRSSTKFEQTVTVTFIYYVVCGPYLELGKISNEDYDLVPSDLKKMNFDLDLKYCFVDPTKKYARVVPILVQNISSGKFILSAQSNLAQQCFLFTDANLENSLTSGSIQLNAGQSSFVYIALQPSLIPNSPANSPRRGEMPAPSLDCRSLIGGIRFLISTPCENPNSDMLSKKILVDAKGNIQIYTHNVKFTATIGQSYLNVPERVIDFGSWAPRGEPILTSLTVQNLSSKMPLYFDLETDSQYIYLQEKSGYIAALADSSNAEITSKMVSLRFTGTKSGYYNEIIKCFNRNNSTQEVFVAVRAFIEPHALQVKNQFGLPAQSLLSWNGLYAKYCSTPGNLSRLSCCESKEKFVQELSITNVTKKAISLCAISNIEMPLIWKDLDTQESGEEFAKQIRQGFKVANNVCTILPSETVVLAVSPPDPILPFNDEAKVLQGRITRHDGIFLLVDVDTNSELKVFNVSATYATSLGTIEPLAVQLGKVGHISYWNEVKTSFTITNRSELDLMYDIRAAAHFDIKIFHGSETVTEYVVPKGEMHIVQCVLKPRLLPPGLEGEQNDKIKFINLQNPENCFEVLINYCVTQFELRFERLSNGELTLPALVHPFGPSALPCDNWFSISNPSDHEVKFELGLSLSPELVNIVGMEVLFRVSNTPIEVPTVLTPGSSLDFKIRATAKGSMRIKDRKLLDPSGLVFGTISVTSKTHSTTMADDLHLSVTEAFVVKGTLLEGCIFSLSESKLIYSSANLSDSDDEKDEGKVESRVSAGERKSVQVTNNSIELLLELKVFLKYPIEFSSSLEHLFEISPLEDGIVKIPPGQTSEIFLTLQQSSIYGATEDIKLHFVDINSINESSNIVPIVFEAKQADEVEFQTADVKQLFEKPSHLIDITDRAIDSPMMISSPPFTRALSVVQSDRDPKLRFDLKGLKRAGNIAGNGYTGMYVLDLGTLEVSSSPLVKKISLEIKNGARILFRVTHASPEDGTWLSFSRSEGVLDHLAGLSHSILFNVSLANPGIFCSYIVFENLDNPADAKYVKVSLKVVTKHNSKRNFHESPLEAFAISNSIFKIGFHSIDGNQQTMDVGPVAFGKIYASRTIFIQNCEPYPLEFEVKCKIPAGDESEVIFSSSKTQAVVAEIFRVEGRSIRPIYMQFILKQTTATEFEKNFEISISCLTVTDVEKKIMFHSLCFHNELQVSKNELYFTSSSDPQTIVISNNGSSSVEGQIVYGATNFSLEIVYHKREILKPKFQSLTSRLRKYLDLSKDEPDTQMVGEVVKSESVSAGISNIILEAKGTLTIKVVPNSVTLSKSAFIQDSFVIYNKDNGFESHRIILKRSQSNFSIFNNAVISVDELSQLENQCYVLLKAVINSRFATNPTENQTEIQFLYKYIIDQFSYYCQRENSDLICKLAGLIYQVILAPLQSTSELTELETWQMPYWNFLNSNSSIPQQMKQ